jgi:hypothetical protein
LEEPDGKRHREAVMTKQEKIKAACRAGADAAAAGLPEEPPKGLGSLEIAAWRMGYEGAVDLERATDLVPVAPEPRPGWLRPDLQNVDDQLRYLHNSVRRGHVRQREEGGWFLLCPAQQTPEMKAFVEQYRPQLEEIAQRHPSTASCRARAALGTMKKSQWNPLVNREHAVTKEWLIAAGWTPVKDSSKRGNASRKYWRKRDNRGGRVNVFATADGWKIGCFIDDAQQYLPQCFPTAPAAYAFVHMNFHLDPPAIEPPAIEDWTAL